MRKNRLINNVKTIHVSAKNSQQGVMLLEALIAVLIFSMGILALVGLQAAMIKNTSEARYRAEATFIAQQKLGEIWANTKDRNALAGYVSANEDISNLLPEGKRTTSVSAAPDCAVSVSISWQQPGSDEHTHTTTARINSMLEPDTCIYL